MKNVDGKYNLLISNYSLKFAKEYFNCYNLSGIPMEEEGTSGNTNVHFDKAFFMEEVMTPRMSPRSNLSMFSLKGM